MVGYGYQERNGSMRIMQNPSVTNLAQPEECSLSLETLFSSFIFNQKGDARSHQHVYIQHMYASIQTWSNPAAGTLQFPGNTFTEASASIPQHQFSHLGTTSIGIAPAMYSLPDGNEEFGSQCSQCGCNCANTNLVPRWSGRNGTLEADLRAI